MPNTTFLQRNNGNWYIGTRHTGLRHFYSSSNPCSAFRLPCFKETSFFFSDLGIRAHSWYGMIFYFQNNYAFLTSHIREDPCICPGFSRGSCHVTGSIGKRMFSKLDLHHPPWVMFMPRFRVLCTNASFISLMRGKRLVITAKNAKLHPPINSLW